MANVHCVKSRENIPFCHLVMILSFVKMQIVIVQDIQLRFLDGNDPLCCILTPKEAGRLSNLLLEAAGAAEGE